MGNFIPFIMNFDFWQSVPVFFNTATSGFQNIAELLILGPN